MSYAEAIEYLYSLRLFGTKFGLENTFRLAELAGNPHRQLRFIHVAGTNGKGSTCAMIESIYRASGLKTGLFTSPHLISFCERLQINRVLISESEVVRLVSELQPLLASFPTEAHPTFFEVVTVMALQYFAKQQCDIVIWETGLGGRLDATNIVTPLASVITNVQYDHEQWLGHSLSEIAFEKAGIIKPGVPVITGTNAPEALAVIRKIANEKAAPLTEVQGDAPLLNKIDLSLAGEHQRRNAAVALAAVESLQKVFPVSPSAIHHGLQTVSWPGRLQLITDSKGRKILLDGAHNVDGAKALREAIPHLIASRPDAIVLGMLRDKNCEGVCKILASLAETIYLVPVESDRTAAPEFLAPFCSSANSAAQVIACTSLGDAFDRASAAGFLLITGSLYLIGQALELLQIRPSPPNPERQLNDWTADLQKQPR